MKTFHYNVSAHLSQDGQFDNNSEKTRVEESMGHYIHGRCILQNYPDKASVIKAAWIRPEDLTRYQKAGIDIFKIQGRDAKPEDMLKTVSMYMAGQTSSPVTSLSMIAGARFGFTLDNQALDGFLDYFENEPYRCNEGCDSCQYCYKVAERAVIVDENITFDIMFSAGKMVSEALTFERTHRRANENGT